ncbi:ACP S-malonyltransferase [Treponema primitia]|uniref:ACP S-malonyltransferase n=1 Tax=Treponema primitia TaxID=88058 RepID=UPI0002555529|nr:ACP S-malonyltransferase [Treponema primitia]
MVTNKTKAAFLFPGQGAQYPGMALDFLALSKAAAVLFALASEAMGRDMEALLRDSDAEFLKRSDIAQPTVTLANLCAAAFLKDRDLKPVCVAGHSLGEYAALVSAGVISPADCLKLVVARGKAMQETVEHIAKQSGGGADSAPGMAAVIGLAPDQVETLVKSSGIADLYAANINSPRQVVVAGTAKALTAAEAKFKEAGAKRVLRLQVAGPFHSPLMAEAADRFGPVLESITFKDPVIPLFSNVSGKEVRSGAEAQDLALKQITSPVRWIAEEHAIAALGIEIALETGPGKVLQGLWKDSGAELPGFPAGKVEEITALFNN